MNFFENPAVQSTSSTTKDAKFKNAGAKTAQEIFEIYLQKNNRIAMEDFIDIYGGEEIAKDKKSLENMIMTERYDTSDKHGTVLENVIVDVAEKNLWFGENENYLIQLSEYDDKAANGAHADAILEMKTEDGNIVRIGIDFTLATNGEKLAKKREKCINGVESGRLFSAKYFQSELTEEKGKLRNIPVVMAGFDRESLQQLCAAIGKKENFEAHCVQFMLLDEILHQLDVLVAISTERNGMNHSLTQKLDYYREIFIKILQKKESLRPNDFREKALNDSVYKYITKYF